MMNWWQSLETLEFVWPWALLLLLAIPLYWWWVVRQHQTHWRQAMTLSTVALVQQLRLDPSPWKRLLRPILTTLLMVLLSVAAARPTVTVQTLHHSVDMMLVFDISISMLADDIEPTRLAAAQAASIRFVESLPDDVRIGLILFAGNTYVVSPPVAEHGKITAYLRSLTPDDLRTHTEIGSAIQAALTTFEKQALQERSTQPAEESTSAPPVEIPQAEDTERSPDRVLVLVSDGDSREGYPWDVAADNAREANVSIFTVGIGGAEPTSIIYDGQVLPVTFNENTLRDIAMRSQGQFFRVFDQADFDAIYQAVRERSVQVSEESVDLAAVLAMGSLLLTLLAVVVLRAPTL